MGTHSIMAEIPSPPPGFELVPQRAGGSVPPPPAGFELVAPIVGQRTFERDPDEALYQRELANIRDARSKPQVPTPDDEFSPEELAQRRVTMRRGREVEQKQFDASRTPMKRIQDTSAFIASAPVRALTRGEYGIGDVVGAASESEGQALTEAEGSFARANRDWLEPVAQAGEAAIGIPLLQSMGAVPG